jgi:cell wall-associated NlpC family hydrolase
MHIADQYVGLPFVDRGRGMEGVDCWGLVRLFLVEQAGLHLPRFDRCDSVAETIAHESMRFASVDRADARLFDVVIANEEVRCAEGWHKAPIHMGVVVDPGRVLHITERHTSRVDPMALLDVVEIRRVL